MSEAWHSIRRGTVRRRCIANTAAGGGGEGGSLLVVGEVEVVGRPHVDHVVVRKGLSHRSLAEPEAVPAPRRIIRVVLAKERGRGEKAREKQRQRHRDTQGETHRDTHTHTHTQREQHSPE